MLVVIYISKIVKGQTLGLRGQISGLRGQFQGLAGHISGLKGLMGEYERSDELTY